MTDKPAAGPSDGDGATAPADAGTDVGRRAVIQSLIGGIGAGLALPSALDAHPVHEHLADQGRTATAARRAVAPAYKPEFLDAHRFKTLEAIAERVVPGSTKANVAPFIDQLLAVDAPAAQQRFVGALGAFDMHAATKHARPWTALTATEQDALLQEASTVERGLRTWVPDGTWRAVEGPGRATIRDHFEHLKGWISGAYYSSEAGMRELGWTGNMFHAELPGCPHPDGHKG